jgi:hypothetical protein
VGHEVSAVGGAEDRIIRAVLDAGRSPVEHERQMERLRAEWPTLAGGIAALLVERGHRVPPPWAAMPPR